MLITNFKNKICCSFESTHRQCHTNRRTLESSLERATRKVVEYGFEKASKKAHRKNNPDCGSQEISFFPLELQWD